MVSVGVQTSARARPILHGGHVFLDVLRGTVLAHAVGCHVPHRVQGDAVLARNRLGHTGAAGIHLRGAPDGDHRRNSTVSTFYVLKSMYHKCFFFTRFIRVVFKMLAPPPPPTLSIQFIKNYFISNRDFLYFLHIQTKALFGKYKSVYSHIMI